MSEDQVYGYPRPSSGELINPKPMMPPKMELHPFGVPPPVRVDPGQMAQVMGRLERIEAKLDALISALADDDEKPQHSLDGDVLPADRMEGEPL